MSRGGQSIIGNQHLDRGAGSVEPGGHGPRRIVGAPRLAFEAEDVVVVDFQTFLVAQFIEPFEAPVRTEFADIVTDALPWIASQWAIKEDAGEDCP